MVRCNHCQHEWETLDPFGCCPKCGLNLNGLMNIEFDAAGHITKRRGYQSATYLKSGIAIELDEKTRIAESLLQQGLISKNDMAVLLGFPNMCDAFKTQMIDPVAVIKWLMDNGFTKNLTVCSYSKSFNHALGGGSTIEVTDIEIVDDPIGTITRVEQWHDRNFLLYDGWPWDSEETRKIDLEEFYKGTKGKNDQTWCNHEWVDYVGLNESFKFCKKCDKKWENK